MGTIRNFILAFFGLFLLTQCNTKRELAGEWKYTNSIWYSSELTLQDNGTFQFHDQGCNAQKFSRGKWTNANGIIQLTSFDAFKPKEQIDAVDSFPVFPGPNDTIRVYLDKIQLQLKNDTLYCISSNKLPEEAKFHRPAKR